MTDDGARLLSAELGRELPAELLKLGSERLAALAQVVREAKRQQAENLDKATEEALAQLPMMLRGPAKKVLGR